MPRARPATIPTPTGKTLADQLRRAVLASKRTLYDLGTEAEVDKGSLGRFLEGERDLSLANAGKLAQTLGLVLRTQDSGLRTRKRAQSSVLSPQFFEKVLESEEKESPGLARDGAEVEGFGVDSIAASPPPPAGLSAGSGLTDVSVPPSSPIPEIAGNRTAPDC